MLDNEDDAIRNAYFDGYDAYRDGCAVSDNPYCASMEFYLWTAWNEGYHEAAWDD